ncbi:hypothetical protein KC359_g121 [Hortaea werneckii]|nr:hypothetical protein KC359_g121 [Hortaea werneckii]KAI7515048.1 hypothetical protein KC347_g114 [Hortaea werneckii]
MARVLAPNCLLLLRSGPVSTCLFRGGTLVGGSADRIDGVLSGEKERGVKTLLAAIAFSSLFVGFLSLHSLS